MFFLTVGIVENNFFELVQVKLRFIKELVHARGVLGVHAKLAFPVFLNFLFFAPAINVVQKVIVDQPPFFQRSKHFDEGFLTVVIPFEENIRIR